jgi:hypothetical protein
MSDLRRYEILVPLLFNDGRPVPESLLAQTFAELRERFGSASWETQTVRGAWQYQGEVYLDNLTRFFVDVPDLPEHRAFFRDFKQKLKARFDQLEIWITSYPLDVI